MSDDLIERLRATYTAWNNPPSDGLPEGAGVLLEAADALAAKDTALSEMRAELAEALDDVKFAERIATKREIDANAARDEALRLLEVQIAGHKLSAKEATQNLIRATKAEAELKLWQDVKHSSHWKDRATAAEAELERVKKALEDAEDTLRLIEQPEFRDPRYGDEVEALGRRIGFGALMSSASASWREYLATSGSPVGGEFVAGPCRGTVIATLAKIRAARALAPSIQDEGGER